MNLRKIIIQKLFKDEDGYWHPVKFAGWICLAVVLLTGVAVCNQASIFHNAPYSVQRCCAEKCMGTKHTTSCKVDCVKYNLCK